MVTIKEMSSAMKRAMGWLAAAVATLALAAPAVASTITYYHNDLAGSPVAATNSSAQVIWRESYRPYGERLTKSAAAKANDVWFTSRRQDSTGLVYMGARYYDPVTGRFVSTDPNGFDEANVSSFGRYTYANDNPYKFVDPNGRSAMLVAEGAIFAAIVWAATQTPDQKRQQIESARRFVESILIWAEGDKAQSGSASSGSTSQGNGTNSSGPVPGAKPGRETKGRTTQWEKPGDMSDADRDFDNLNPADVKDLPNGGRVGSLSDGRTVIVRPDSSDGRPTLEIQTGRNKDKVRYGE